jgi:hypothetical protein
MKLQLVSLVLFVIFLWLDFVDRLLPLGLRSLLLLSLFKHPLDLRSDKLISQPHSIEMENWNSSELEEVLRVNPHQCRQYRIILNYHHQLLPQWIIPEVPQAPVF